MGRILCFGDSLTHGSVPNGNGPTFERYDKSIRWTGVLASLLGDNFEVIEEGLPSRTIGLEDPRPGKEGRNGSTYFRPCLESHTPIDVLVLWLGTNNTKDFYNQSPDVTIESLERLILSNKDFFDKNNTKLILVTPTKIDVEKALDNYASAAPKLKSLSGLYKALASRLNIHFVDMYNELDVPKTADGIHLSEIDNLKVAQIIERKIREII